MSSPSSSSFLLNGLHLVATLILVDVELLLGEEGSERRGPSADEALPGDAELLPGEEGDAPPRRASADEALPGDAELLLGDPGDVARFPALS